MNRIKERLFAKAIKKIKRRNRLENTIKRFETQKQHLLYDYKSII